jgi:intracellular septation protein A
MQTLIEFLPLIAFLLAYQWAGIYAATATLMVAMAVLLGVNRWRAGEIAPWHLASADTEAKPERETP